MKRWKDAWQRLKNNRKLRCGGFSAALCAGVILLALLLVALADRLESRYAACFGEMDMQQMERYTRGLQSLFARYGMRETLSRLPDALHMPHMLYRIDTLCAYDVISGAAPRRLLPALWSGDESPVWDQRPPRAPAPVRMPAYDRFHPLSGQRRTAQRRKML